MTVNNLSIQVMNCVFQTLLAISVNKAISTPTRIAKMRLDIHKAQSFKVLPMCKNDECEKATVKTEGSLSTPPVLVYRGGTLSTPLPDDPDL